MHAGCMQGEGSGFALLGTDDLDPRARGVLDPEAGTGPLDPGAGVVSDPVSGVHWIQGQGVHWIQGQGVGDSAGQCRMRVSGGRIHWPLGY